MRVLNVETMPPRDQGFLKKLKMAGIRNLSSCYQCSACSSGCPVGFAMDYFPNQVIHMVRMCLKETVLQSKTIWICNSCETCATRCPNQIDIVRLMNVLRSMALQEGFKCAINEIPRFHKIFLKEIQKRGRIHELKLLTLYKLRAGHIFSIKRMREDIGLGLRMFQKGKLKVFLSEMNNKKDVKGIFRKVLARNKAS